MFKEITSISKNYALVKLVGNINEDILNFNVIFDEPNKKILGEIEEIIDDKIKDLSYNNDKESKAAKYKLMRAKNELNKKLIRVGGTREMRKLI